MYSARTWEMGACLSQINGRIISRMFKNQDLNEGLEELRKVRKELKNFPPSDVIWDAEDLSLTPPWGNNISSDITDLSNYFVTSDGRDLISVLSEAMNEAKEMQCDIEIDNL